MDFFRRYNYDYDAVSVETGIGDFGEDMTQQNFKEEADINTIARRWSLTGVPPVDVYRPTYEDFLGVSDYRSAMDAIMEADNAFASMPADIRARFANDPAKFVDFTSNAANLEEMRKMGLLVPEPEPDRIVPVPVGGGDGQVVT